MKFRLHDYCDDEGDQFDNNKKKYRDQEKSDFRCGYCKLMVPSQAYGTKHRNHCPNCGYSRHLDRRKGFRNSDCKSLMKPIGLAWKGDDEISLVHQCLGCSSLDYNRIAGDDNSAMLLDVYKSSMLLDEETKTLLSTEGIELIGPEEEAEVRTAVLGLHNEDF